MDLNEDTDDVVVVDGEFPGLMENVVDDGLTIDDDEEEEEEELYLEIGHVIIG